LHIEIFHQGANQGGRFFFTRSFDLVHPGLAPPLVVDQWIGADLLKKTLADFCFLKGSARISIGRFFSFRDRHRLIVGSKWIRIIIG